LDPKESCKRREEAHKYKKPTIKKLIAQIEERGDVDHPHWQQKWLERIKRGKRRATKLEKKRKLREMKKWVPITITSNYESHSKKERNNKA
jgi:hypothetical protein